MLIPGKSLFIGQRDERTLLSHDGHSFLSGDEEDQRKGTLGFLLQRAFSLVFCETKQAASGGDLFLYGAAIISHRISRVKGAYSLM